MRRKSTICLRSRLDNRTGDFHAWDSWECKSLLFFISLFLLFQLKFALSPCVRSKALMLSINLMASMYPYPLPDNFVVSAHSKMGWCCDLLWQCDKNNVTVWVETWRSLACFCFLSGFSVVTMTIWLNQSIRPHGAELIYSIYQRPLSSQMTCYLTTNTGLSPPNI